jgi:hypothetical protein
MAPRSQFAECPFHDSSGRPSHVSFDLIDGLGDFDDVDDTHAVFLLRGS